MNILRNNIQYLGKLIRPSLTISITVDSRDIVFDYGYSSSTALAVQRGAVFIIGSPTNKHAWGEDT